MRRLYPFAVLLAYIFGRVLFEHDNILIGDDVVSDFRHGWGFYIWKAGGFLDIMLWSIWSSRNLEVCCYYGEEGKEGFAGELGGYIHN